MQDTDIFVQDSATDKRILVGTLYIKNNFTKEGQTYNIEFQVACGNEIELTVKHSSGQGYSRRGCISIAEIEVYNQPSVFFILCIHIYMRIKLYPQKKINQLPIFILRDSGLIASFCSKILFSISKSEPLIYIRFWLHPMFKDLELLSDPFLRPFTTVFHDLIDV